VTLAKMIGRPWKSVHTNHWACVTGYAKLLSLPASDANVSIAPRIRGQQLPYKFIPVLSQIVPCFILIA
jgi:hypothetical protein